VKLYELEMVEVDDITKNDPNPKEVDEVVVISMEMKEEEDEGKRLE